MPDASPPPPSPAGVVLAGTHAAVVLGLCAVLCLAGAVWPPSPLTRVGYWYAGGAVLAVATVAAVVWRHHPRTPLVAVLLGIAVGAAMVAVCRTAAGVVTTSLGLVVAGQAAALLGSRRLARGLLLLVVVTLAGAMVAAPVPFRPASWVVLAVMTVVTSELVTYLLSRLRELATTDDLTGVLTRAAFDERAAAVVARTTRDGRPVSLVCLDVDDFKEVNDTQGHQAGDDVLVRLVDAWRGTLGRHDVIGRRGGDEFAVVLAGRTAEDAEVWAMQADAVRAPGDPTWSHGVAQARRDEPVREVLARADAALYARKGDRMAEGLA